jgi:hypothetical protein
MFEQELATGCLCEGKLSARVNRAEVIEILVAGWEAKKMRRIAARPNTKKAVERQLSDARLHVVLHLTRKR